MTRTHTKPFDLIAAKAGAPVSVANHTVEVEILKYGDKKIYGILYSNIEESAETWQLDGTYGMGGTGSNTLQLVMLPLGYCEGKPVFVGDELIDAHGRYKVGPKDTFDGSEKWPKPEPKYPETQVSVDELAIAYNSDEGFSKSLRKVANLAVKRSIQDGDVFTKQQVTAVLEQLRGICDKYVNPHNIRSVMDQTDWDEVLKEAM